MLYFEDNYYINSPFVAFVISENEVIDFLWCRDICKVLSRERDFDC